MRRWARAAAVVGLVTAGRAEASLMTYRQTATASGSLGGQSFTDELITLISTANTNDVTGGPTFFSVTC